MFLSDKRKNLYRMNEIARVLIKYGFDTVANKIVPGNKFFKTDIYDDISEDTNVRIRMVLQELGTTFIKLGQTLSTYPNLVGYELAQELSKLQESSPIDDFQIVKEIIEEEFSEPLDQIFEEFSEKPIASASIGQVHTAYMNNKHVAIKVQHKDVEKKVKSDIAIMHILANRLTKSFSSLVPYNLQGIVEVFENDMQKELDYKFEAMNMVHLATLLKDDEVYVPEAYLEYTSNKVLTMEYLEGVSLNSVINAPDEEYDKEKIATEGADSFIKQILIHGFFHADPHPGNIFVLDNDRVAFVDFGMVGHLSNSLKEDLAKLFIFASDGDARLISKQLYYMGIIPNRRHIKEIEYEIMDILDKCYGVQFNDVSGIFREIIENDLLNKYGLKIPRDLMMVIRTITIIDDVGKQLCPDFNTTEMIKPYALTMFTDTVKPKRLMSKATEGYIDIEHVTEKLPDSINNFFDVFEDGRMNMVLEYDDLEKLNNIISRIVNELVLAIITAALLIGSSLIMQTDAPIEIFGYSILGFLGFSFSAITGVILIILIIRRGNY